ncbi:CBS domain-containing protein [Thermodesulfobacteriota bacterium]
MEIVITHRSTDFDALASQIAVAKLHPGTVMVGAGGVEPIVKKFLVLHRDHFELMPVKEIDFAAVTRVFVVDVRRAGRLSDFGPLLRRIHAGDPSLEIHIYDHHEGADDDIDGQHVRVEYIGSVTTMLVEELIERDVPIAPVEATALALGIYADTGSLTYANTTPRDAAAAAELVSRGVDMTTLRYFLQAPLADQHRQILSTMLAGSTLLEIEGVKIGLSTVPLNKAVPGLSEIVNKVLMIEGNDATFALFPRGKSVTMIGRSWMPTVDVGSIMQELGGGGHHGAGAATLKDSSVDDARAALMAVLEKVPPKPYLVRYLMSSPVHHLSHDQVLGEVEADFKQRNISGAPVCRDGQIIGMLSKRDIRTARQAERLHLPVSSCMIHDVKTIEPDKPLVRAFEKMVADNVGRLPVEEEGRLVGIITRNDILKVLYRPRRKEKEDD